LGTGSEARLGHTITWPHVDPRHPLRDPPDSDITAAVALKLTVDKTGKVIAATVVKNSGHKSLDDAAIKEALRTWRLVPGTNDGKAATLPVTMWFHFWEYVADDVRHARSCVLLSQLSQTSVIDDHTILVRMKDKTYRLLKVGNCTGLKRHGFAYNLLSNDLCE